jgi:hypothetical protein
LRVRVSVIAAGLRQDLSGFLHDPVRPDDVDGWPLEVPPGRPPGGPAINWEACLANKTAARATTVPARALRIATCPHRAADGSGGIHMSALWRLGSIIIIAWICLSLSMTPLAAAAEPGSTTSSSYAELLARVRRGQDVDFLALRNAYAQDPSYDPYGFRVASWVAEMYDAYNAGDCGTALARAQSILQLNFVHIDAHFASARCQERAGHEEAGRRSMALVRGLLGSVLKSGDGKTMETAFHVVTIAEEYSVLRAFRLVRQHQTLLRVNGRSYDRLDAKAQDGTMVSIYFNVDRPVAAPSRGWQSRRP